MNGRVAGCLRSLSGWAVAVGLCASSAFAAASSVVPPATSHQSKPTTTSPYPRISIPRAVAPADGKMADRELFSPDEGPDLLVVVFVSTTCPIANAAIPELRRISERTRSMKGEVILVHPDPEATGETVARHDETTRVHATSLLDPEHRLVSMLGATVVPEAFILEREAGRWTLRYRGPVDNLYADIGRRRRQATVWHVRSALEALERGDEIAVVSRPAIGCRIERWRP